MTRIPALLCLVAAAWMESGCGTACGPVRTVPPQRLALVTPTPDSYTIRVCPKVGAPIETRVPPDGRVVFAVPVRSRASTVLCFGLPVYHYPPPETLRVIQVVRDQRTVHTLSAQDIDRLPTDADGYHLLMITK
jgi:hypothetical protein